MLLKLERRRTFWYAPQIIIAVGATRMETFSEYAIVIAAVMANCWEAGSGEDISTPMPSAVVSAEPSNAGISRKASPISGSAQYLWPP